MGSIRDILHVARFEVLRAVRTWRAMALFVLYTVAATGAAYLFVQMIGIMENQIAAQMSVPETTKPGAMLDTLMASDNFRELLGAMVGSDLLVEHVLSIPVLAVFNLWMGYLLIPFFAASSSAECIALDVQSRALRYEALRTGRLELVLGRFGGQLLLTGMASLLSVVGVWAVGVFFMVGNDPALLAGWLIWLTGRAWTFSVPFVGLGVACSQITTSPAWARVLAVGATAGSWMLFGTARWAESEGHGMAADLLLQILPQGWMRGMWEPGMGWAPAAVVCGALGLSALAVGYLWFAKRDL